MTVMQCYSIYDLKAQCYSLPFFLANDEVAQRVFLEIASDVNTSVSKFTDDYDMFHVGTFNVQTGVFESVDPRVVIAGFTARHRLFGKEEVSSADVMTDYDKD